MIFYWFLPLNSILTWENHFVPNIMHDQFNIAMSVVVTIINGGDWLSHTFVLVCFLNLTSKFPQYWKCWFLLPLTRFFGSHDPNLYSTLLKKSDFLPRSKICLRIRYQTIECFTLVHAHKPNWTFFYHQFCTKNCSRFLQLSYIRMRFVYKTDSYAEGSFLALLSVYQEYLLTPKIRTPQMVKSAWHLNRTKTYTGAIHILQFPNYWNQPPSQLQWNFLLQPSRYYGQLVLTAIPLVSAKRPYMFS